MGDDAQALGGTISFAVIIVVGVLFFLCALCSIEEPPRDTADAELSLELAAARASAAHEASAAAQAGVILQSELPYFPYAASSQAAECAICVETLLTGQLCSEVPACLHAFHRDCLGAWAKSKGSCPLCRARIVPGSEECAICVEPLRQGQLCSEVTACRHAFHRYCLGVWVKSTGSCPLCRARIVPGSDEVGVADDMV